MGALSGVQPMERGKHTTSPGLVSRYHGAWERDTSLLSHVTGENVVTSAQKVVKSQLSAQPCALLHFHYSGKKGEMKDRRLCHPSIRSVLVPFSTDEEID